MTPILPYKGGSDLSVRGGDVKAPLAPIGCIWLMGGQTVSLSNRGVHLINPYLTDEQRAGHAGSGGVYRDAHEFFAQRVDAASNWLEGGASAVAPWLAIHDFERWCGNVGDGDRYFDSNEMNRSIEFGKRWLVDGMLECAANLVAAGRQVIFHSGCPDSANYAGDLIRCGRGADARASVFTTYQALLRRGIGIGMDNAGAQPENSLTYHEASSLALSGAYIQVEATPDLKARQWHGFPCRSAYHEFFRRHLKQEEWAVSRHPLMGSDKFRAIHPDCRVAIYPEHVPDAKRIDGNEADKRAYLAAVSEMTKPLVAEGVRPLLHERIIFEADKLGVGVGEFLK
jgi:hypothetical protein